MKPLEEMNEDERNALLQIGQMAMAVDDFEFADYVVSHRAMGFGRMMQIISYLWRAALEHDYPENPGIANAAFVSALFYDLDESAQKEYMAIYENDVLAPYIGYWVKTE